jgi:hypothetical protein
MIAHDRIRIFQQFNKELREEAMKKQILSLTSLLLVSGMLLTACSGVSAALSKAASQINIAHAATSTLVQAAPSSSGTTASSSSSSTNSTSYSLRKHTGEYLFNCQPSGSKYYGHITCEQQQFPGIPWVQQ